MNRKQRHVAALRALEVFENKAIKALQSLGSTMEACSGEYCAIVTALNHCSECRESGLAAWKVSNFLSNGLSRAANYCYKQIDLESGITGYSEYGIAYRS